ncbi:MAG: CvpA family protein [Robiginitomaculum sp.]|nr:CvpA family protein [Robiginitomaculum sp.]
MDIGPLTFGGFDIVVFLILGFSGILAFARGLSREIISILALLIGLAVSLFVFGRYRIGVQNFIRPSWLADGALFIGVFALFYLLTSFVLRGWAKNIRGQTPGFFERLLGFGFGLLRGAILASLFVLVASKSAKNDEPAEWMTEAATYPFLRKISDTLQTLPFARAKEIADEIKTKGEESDILPDIPKNDP